MGLGRILWTLFTAMITSTLGVALGYFVESLLIDRGPFDRNAERIRFFKKNWRFREPRFFYEREPLFFKEIEEFWHSLGSLGDDAGRAIGLGLITKEEVAAAGGESLAQSNLAFGLVLPMSLILFATAYRLQLRFIGFMGIAVLVLISNAALVVAGIDRLYSYRLGLLSLILGRFEKQLIDRIEGNQREGRG
jgi:hypothetical protein